MSLRHLLVLPAALASLLLACDDDSPAGPADPTAQSTNPTNPTNPIDATDPADTTDPTASADAADPTVATNATDAIGTDTTVSVVPDYPEGPYGAEYLDTIADLGFYDPWYGVTVSMHEYYKSTDKRVIVLTSGAGWCTACQYEAWDLVEAMDKYGDAGLEVLYTLYEDNNGKTLWKDGSTPEELDADHIYLNIWRANLGYAVDLPIRVANFRVLVDVGFKLGAYYDKAATPMTLIIRTSDMKILYRQIGYNRGAIESIVKGVIY